MHCIDSSKGVIAGLVIGSSNTPLTNTVKAHNFKNGFCEDCGALDEPLLNSDSFYEIENAGQLYWFSMQVRHGDTDINGKLISDITVNEFNMILADKLKETNISYSVLGTCKSIKGMYYCTNGSDLIIEVTSIKVDDIDVSNYFMKNPLFSGLSEIKTDSTAEDEFNVKLTISDENNSLNKLSGLVVNEIKDLNGNNVEISVLPQPIIELYTLQIPLIECSIICNQPALKKRTIAGSLFSYGRVPALLRYPIPKSLPSGKGLLFSAVAENRAVEGNLRFLNPCHFVTSPFRGTPTTPYGRVGRPRCFNFLRKSR